MIQEPMEFGIPFQLPYVRVKIMLVRDITSASKNSPGISRNYGFLEKFACKKTKNNVVLETESRLKTESL